MGLTAGMTLVQDSRTNPKCSDLAATYGSGATWFEAKLDHAPSATDSVTDGTITVSITNGSSSGFNWSATRGVDAVLVKAGSGPHNVYLYSPEAAADSGLVKLGQNGISHISFCYDVELEVTKTANPTFTRDYDWTIAKSVDQAAVALENAGQATVNYSVAVAKDAGTDSAWAVAGTITVTNPHATVAASGINVTDSLSGVGAVTVSCPSTSVAAGASMVCTYGSVSLPNSDTRTNTATATSTSSGFATGTGSASVAFVTPTTVHDNSVSITDTFAGAGLNGTSISASQTFNYSRTISGADFSCDTTTNVNNTASLATDDGATRTSSASVAVTKTCPATSTGCTLTQGYWGTHGASGTSKYDQTWTLIGPSAQNTAFYSSGASYYNVLQTPTKGNAYYILAHQYIAARLNILKGATAPAGFNMAQVNTFFTTYNPAQIAALKGGSAVRANAIAWAATLDSYNNGLLNVAHCGS